MRRPSVRFRLAAPPKRLGQDPLPSPGVLYFPAQSPSRPTVLSPTLSRSVPEVLVDQVAVQVQRHGRRGVAQDALDNLPVGSRSEPNAVWRSSCTRRVGTPIAFVGVAHRTERFRFGSDSGPHAARRTSQSP